MTTLREAAQQALEALEATASYDIPAPRLRRRSAITALRAALAEPEPFNPDWDRIEPLQENLREHMAEIQRLRSELALQRFTDVSQEIEAALSEPVQEPPCATRECMPSKCPNCVSLEAQNTELDRKLADIEQTSLELCNVCGWKTLIPGDCCLNCERKHPLGQASTDVGVPVYVVKQAEPVQEPVAVVRSVVGQGDDGVRIKWLSGFPQIGDRLYTAPPQRKPLTREEAIALWADKSDGPSTGEIVSFARAIERAHGIT